MPRIPHGYIFARPVLVMSFLLLLLILPSGIGHFWNWINQIGGAPCNEVAEAPKRLEGSANVKTKWTNQIRVSWF